jgi:hypothetical protein
LRKLSRQTVRKRFGQHFLEPAWVDKVIRAIDPKPDELFIEIGPGRGALTRPLVERAMAVTAYEIDRDLAADLRAAAIPAVTVVEGDFLEAASNVERRMPNGSVRVAGNLPYNVASPILFKLVELYALGVPLVDATVMLQREVANRLTAAPGSRPYGVLSILIRRPGHFDRRQRSIRRWCDFGFMRRTLRFGTRRPSPASCRPCSRGVERLWQTRCSRSKEGLRHRGARKRSPRRTWTGAADRKLSRSSNSHVSPTRIQESAKLCYSFAVNRSARPI